MLQNDYLVTKIGVDTAENEPRIASDVPWQLKQLGVDPPASARGTVLIGECAHAHLTPDTGYGTSHTHRITSADIECLALWRNPRSPSAQSRRIWVGDAARQGCGGVCRIRREVP